MKLDSEMQARLNFLLRVVERERTHLSRTDQRLFAKPFTVNLAQSLNDNEPLAERVEAFVSRFGRLQDTLGDKLLPLLLSCLGEPTGPAIDNLDRAERLGLVPSVDELLSMRRLRNQMVREYVEDPNVLTDALTTAHEFVPVLTNVAHKLHQEALNRGWAATGPTSQAP